MSEGRICISSSLEFFSKEVQEASEKCQVNACPLVKTYLAHLLSQFISVNHLFEDSDGVLKRRTLSEMYFQASQASSKTEQVERFKKLGDQSLYVSGFFRPVFEKWLVDASYYTEMGQAAYDFLLKQSEDERRDIYKAFAYRFSEFVEILHYISENSKSKWEEKSLSLVKTYD